MDELITSIKQDIIDELNLEDVKPEDIDADAPLFGEGLGLDSIDVLSLIVIMEKKYGLKIDTPDEGKKVFYSVSTIADYINNSLPK